MSKKSIRRHRNRGNDNPTLSQAEGHEDWPKWKEAIDLEYQDD